MIAEKKTAVKALTDAQIKEKRKAYASIPSKYFALTLEEVLYAFDSLILLKDNAFCKSFKTKIKAYYKKGFIISVVPENYTLFKDKRNMVWYEIVHTYINFYVLDYRFTEVFKSPDFKRFPAQCSTAIMYNLEGGLSHNPNFNLEYFKIIEMLLKMMNYTQIMISLSEDENYYNTHLFFEKLGYKTIHTLENLNTGHFIEFKVKHLW
jgi:hypothetical protein